MCLIQFLHLSVLKLIVQIKQSQFLQEASLITELLTDDWVELANHLHVSKDFLHKTMEHNIDAKEAKSRMLKHWMLSDPHASLDEIKIVTKTVRGTLKYKCDEITIAM